MSTAPIACSEKDGPLRLALEFVLQGALAMPGPSDDPVIGLVIPTEPDGADWPEKAATILNRHPRCAGLAVAHNHDEQIYDHLRAGLRVPFCEGVRFANPRGTLLFDLLYRIGHFSESPPSNETMDRTREVVFAKALYRRLEICSHGGTKDITNQVLAPLNLRLRLGQALEGDEEIRILREFSRTVLKSARGMGLLGGELRIAFARLFRALRRHTTACSDELDRVMDLLTECRKSAGGAVPLRTREDEVYVQATRDSAKANRYRILVVDDHWKFWELFFKALGKIVRRILGSADVIFESLPLKDNALPEAVLERLPAYDLVLLDIFLGRDLDEDGLTILSRIRKHCVNVPVILWTSSRETELPAMARLAHGFLFKKSSRPEHIACVLARHLREGRARRLYPIPNHFFDQSIVDEDTRKCALRFTEYCSKQLDSFHALDDQQFRHFTDHGGRHLFKLLELLGELLRPLLDDTEAVFSSNPEKREEEILSLYLSVFLHEFGMLRLQGRGEPDWDCLMDNKGSEARMGELSCELSLVRAFHSLRGMILLARHPETEANHWPDNEGRNQSLKRLWNERRAYVRYVRPATALIVGHHSRLLPLDAPHGKWNHQFRKDYARKAAKALGLASDKADNAMSHLQRRFFSFDASKGTLAHLVKEIDPSRLNLLRKHCAIFRFVDAIDLDHTRNPARFLCAARTITNLDCRETLKRQVVRKVMVEGGTIQMETNVPPPDKELVREVVGKIRGLPDDLDTWISPCPWRNATAKLKWREECQSKMDEWLEKFWDKPLKHRKSFFEFHRGVLSDAAKLQIASITALSVAWEVLEEYRAIVDCELAGKIRLGNFWRDEGLNPKDWLKRQKDMLPILFDEEKDGLDYLTRRP